MYHNTHQRRPSRQLLPPHDRVPGPSDRPLSPGPSRSNSYYERHIPPSPGAQYRDEHPDPYRANTWRPGPHYTRSPSPERYPPYREPEVDAWNRPVAWADPAPAWGPERRRPQSPVWDRAARDPASDRVFEPNASWKEPRREDEPPPDLYHTRDAREPLIDRAYGRQEAPYNGDYYRAYAEEHDQREYPPPPPPPPPANPYRAQYPEYDHPERRDSRGRDSYPGVQADPEFQYGWKGYADRQGPPAYDYGDQRSHNVDRVISPHTTSPRSVRPPPLSYSHSNMETSPRSPSRILFRGRSRSATERPPQPAAANESTWSTSPSMYPPRKRMRSRSSSQSSGVSRPRLLEPASSGPRSGEHTSQGWAFPQSAPPRSNLHDLIIKADPGFPAPANDRGAVLVPRQAPLVSGQTAFVSDSGWPRHAPSSRPEFEGANKPNTNQRGAVDGTLQRFSQDNGATPANKRPHVPALDIPNTEKPPPPKEAPVTPPRVDQRHPVSATSMARTASDQSTQSNTTSTGGPAGILLPPKPYAPKAARSPLTGKASLEGLRFTKKSSAATPATPGPGPDSATQSSIFVARDTHVAGASGASVLVNGVKGTSHAELSKLETQEVTMTDLIQQPEEPPVAVPPPPPPKPVVKSAEARREAPELKGAKVNGLTAEAAPLAVPTASSKTVAPATVVDRSAQKTKTQIKRLPVDDRNLSDASSVAEALRLAVMHRQRYDRQTFEERVEPVLFSNSLTAEPTSTQAPKSEAVVEDVLAENRKLSPVSGRRETRACLARRFTERQALYTAKAQRLREEYLALHERWVAHCQRLDDANKVGVSEDVNMVSASAAGPGGPVNGRTTRRSAATLGDAVRSDLEMEQIIATLGNEDLTDPSHLALRNLATIPDLITSANGRVDYVYDDTNHLVEDPLEFYRHRTGFEDWNEEEMEIFNEQFAAHPKQFGLIADHLPHKTTSQCVAYYYLHKKKLIDFRVVVTRYAPGKGRRGGKKAGKGKGNALLTDIRRHDDEVSKNRGGRPVRGATRKPPVSTTNAADGRKTGARRGAQFEDTPTSTPTPDPEPEGRPKRRRTVARVATLAEPDDDDESAADATPQPVKQPQKRGRKSKVVSAPIIVEEPTPPPPPTVSKFRLGESSEQPEAPQRRKPTLIIHWSDDDKGIFLKLLAQYGDDFKRIAASMPNKTSSQVSNYYRANQGLLDLDRIAAGAPKRSPSPNSPLWAELAKHSAPASSDSPRPSFESRLRFFDSSAYGHQQRPPSADENGAQKEPTRPSSRTFSSHGEPPPSKPPSSSSSSDSPLANGETNTHTGTLDLGLRSYIHFQPRSEAERAQDGSSMQPGPGSMTSIIYPPPPPPPTGLAYTHYPQPPYAASYGHASNNAPGVGVLVPEWSHADARGNGQGSGQSGQGGARQENGNGGLQIVQERGPYVRPPSANPLSSHPVPLLRAPSSGAPPGVALHPPPGSYMDPSRGMIPWMAHLQPQQQQPPMHSLGQMYGAPNGHGPPQHFDYANAAQQQSQMMIQRGQVPPDHVNAFRW